LQEDGDYALHRLNGKKNPPSKNGGSVWTGGRLGGRGGGKEQKIKLCRPNKEGQEEARYGMGG